MRVRLAPKKPTSDRIVAMTPGVSRKVRPQLSKATWRKERERQKRREPQCRACGKTTGLVAAHAVPAERYPGHHDDPRNLLTLCFGCNNSQGDKTLAEWNAVRASRGLPPVPDHAPSPWAPQPVAPVLGRSRPAYGRPRPRPRIY